MALLLGLGSLAGVVLLRTWLHARLVRRYLVIDMRRLRENRLSGG